MTTGLPTTCLRILIFTLDAKSLKMNFDPELSEGKPGLDSNPEEALCLFVYQAAMSAKDATGPIGP